MYPKPSLRSLERVLKYFQFCLGFRFCEVAPFVGAWIEIQYEKPEFLGGYVAPFVGAWIEIQYEKPEFLGGYVAPFVGAWIEITIY